jgi:Cys-rich protein (TIGR01571 family)
MLGRTGMFCPCVLFGRNVEALREDIPWTAPCVCHAVFVEGGITLAILTAIFHGVDPGSSFLIGEGLMFSWWLCGAYTGIFRQELQKKYHLKVRFGTHMLLFFLLVPRTHASIFIWKNSDYYIYYYVCKLHCIHNCFAHI